MAARKFFYRFGKLLYKIDAYYTEFAKRSGVRPNLLWVLYALDDGEAHSQKEISRSWDIPVTTVNTIVSQLQKDGYVRLASIAGCKREMHVVLTSSGRAYSERLLSELYRIEEKVYTDLGTSADEICIGLENVLSALSEHKREE